MRQFEQPSAERFRQLRDWLLAQGLPSARVVSSIGSAPQGRAIGTIADSLRAELKMLPKKQ